MKYLLLLIIIFLSSCGIMDGECKLVKSEIPETTNRIVKVTRKKTDWEKYFNVSYEVIKKNTEGTYKSEDGLIIANVKIREDMPVYYNTASPNTGCMEYIEIEISVDINDNGIEYHKNQSVFVESNTNIYFMGHESNSLHGYGYCKDEFHKDCYPLTKIQE